MTFFHVIWHAITTWGGLAFIAITVAYVWASAKLFQTLTRQATPSGVTAITLVLAVIFVLLVILQYLCLTGHFLYEFLLYQIVVSVGLYLLNAAYAGVSNTASTEDKEKSFYITVVSTSFSQSLLFYVLGLVFFLVQLGSWYFALARFTYGTNELDTNAHILFFLVVLPVLASAVISILLTLGYILNPDVDNDVRSMHVGSMVTAALSAAAMIVWPHMLFPNYYEKHFGPYFGGNSPATVVIAVTALLAVAAFAVGALAHRSQRIRFRRAQERLAKRALEVLKISRGSYQDRERFSLASKIAAECARCVSSPIFYGFYLAYLVENFWVDGLEAWNAKLTLPIPDLIILYYAYGDGEFAQLETLLRDYGDKIDEWDIKAAHIHVLFDIYTCVVFQDDLPVTDVLSKVAQSDPPSSSKRSLLLGFLFAGIPALFSYAIQGFFEGVGRQLMTLF